MGNNRSIALIASFLLTSVLPAHTSAQQGPTTGGVIRIDVNLVQVDAVVTDSKGKPVTDLKAEDFELLQDGQVQKITNLEFISYKRPAPAEPELLLTVAKPRNDIVPPPPQPRE